MTKLWTQWTNANRESGQMQTKLPPRIMAELLCFSYIPFYLGSEFPQLVSLVEGDLVLDH